MRCPYCGSENISPAEREYTNDYPFWIVLVAVFFLIGIMLLLFFFLQLHPIILILILVAALSKLLDTRSRTRRKTQKVEYICLSCERRFIRRKSSSGDEGA
jgi:DNA-directed RNA polymerase subunit RPC12/RpoP